MAGKSRSSTIIIAYLIKERKMTFEEAFNYVKEKRIKIQPNKGFIKQLLEFEHDSKSEKQQLKMIS